MTPVTAHLPGNNQLLYFTSSSLLADDQKLVYITDRDGHPNLHALDIASGVDRRLTHNREGHLKSYVYFDGRTNHGLGKASVSLDPARGVVYYLQGLSICATDMAGATRIVAMLPNDQVTAFTHLSADGTRLCVPTTDARALEGDVAGNKMAHDIDQRVRDEGLSSYLRVFDTRTGAQVACERVPGAWITHVQFSPADPELILYNHEWPADCGIRRMWLWNGREHVRLRREEDGFDRRDWACHEMWTRNGAEIIYHGKLHNGPAYVGKIDLATLRNTEVPFPHDYRNYGHFTVSNTGRLVSDGYYQTPDDTPVPKPFEHCGTWISLQDVDWSARTIRWTPIVRHGSNWDSQDSHPHPIFNHRADRIYFTSNRDGKRAVYFVNTPA